MKFRIFSVLLIFSLILSMFVSASPVKAEDRFPSPDADSDGLSNELEIGGWYSLAGGPFKTDPRDLDSDNDGLTDGEEKLFNTNPLDSQNPGTAARYDSSFNTLQYFSTTNPAYLSIKQGGDQYLLTEALVVRRGNTFTITGPASGTLTLTGTGMTAINPLRDPARGGWTITLPSAGTVGTYTATITDGGWTKSMPVYVIFEMPTDLPQDQIDAFLYDGDPANKRDEVAVWWRMGYWNYYGNLQETVQPCPGTDPNQPCSLWPYHIGYGMAQAYWTEQFTKSAFVDHAIKAIHGKNTLTNAVNAIASWTDVEFYTHAGTYQNNWSSSIYRYFDGTGYTMAGGDCESTATTYTTLLRSAGIASRPFAVDYVQTPGHGDPTWLLTQSFEYDHATMMWIDGQWYAQRAYGSDELTVDKYYPFNSGPTALQTWTTVGRNGGTWYYNDEYGDVLVSVNEDWDFQNGSSGGGTVNTVWPVTTQEFTPVNRDYQWDSKRPLEIMQSPDVEVNNLSQWFGDNWANTEWRTPIVSNPASPARDESLTYVLPVGVPDPETPIENFPYNPQVTSCSSSTSTAECNALKASKNLINLYITPSNGGTISASPALPSYSTGSTVVITAAPAAGYNFGAWTGACAGQTNPCMLTMSSSRTVSATFTPSGSSSVENSTVSLRTTEGSTASLTTSSNEEVIDFSDTTLYKLDEQTNQSIQFGKILKDYGLDTDQNGRFDQLVIEVEVTSAVKGDYQLSGQLLAGEKSFRGGGSITLDIGKQTVTLAFEGLSIGNNQVKGPYEVQALWIAEKDQIVGPFYLPEVMEAFQTFTYKTGRYKAAEFEVTTALFTDSYSHQGVDKNHNGKYEAITVDVGLSFAVPGAFQVEGDLFDGLGNYVSHATWTGNKSIASLKFNVTKSQPPYTVGNLVLISKRGNQKGALADSRTYKAYEITDMNGMIEGGAVEFAAAETIEKLGTDDGTISQLRVAAVEPNSGAFTFTPVDTNGNGKYDILRLNVSVKADATDTNGNYRIEALLEDEYGTEVAWAVSGGQPIVPSITQKMTLDFDAKMLYDQLPLTGGRTWKLVAAKIFSGNLSFATLESEVKYAVTTPAYTRSQFEPSSPAATVVLQDDMENGAAQWSLTEANVAGAGITYRVNIGAAIGGTFTLTVDSKTTVPMAWNITAANLRTALINAGVTTVGTVSGSGTLAAPWLIPFTGAPPVVTMDNTGLIENVKGAGTIYNVNIGYAVGGTFSLTVDSKTTAPLAWNVTAANLKTAFTDAGVAVSTITGSGALATPWVITFTGAPTAVTIDKTGLIENVSGADTIYRVNIGPAIGGSFTLTVGSNTTAPMDWNVTAANLQTALTTAGAAVTTITGTGAIATPWVITFSETPAAVTIDKTGLIENVIGVSKIYNVNIGVATGGTFTLTVDSKTTVLIAWNVTAANLRTALTNAGVTTSAVTGSGTPASPWVITFTGTPTAVTMDKAGLIGINSIWSLDASVTGADTIYNANIGPALAGTFTLTVDSKTTKPIDWNITAANLKTALTNAGVTTVSTVTGSGTSASPWVITFTGAPTAVTMDKTDLIMASNGGFHGWKANTTVNNVTQQLAIASPLNLTDYASPVLRFNHAYQLGNVSDKAILEGSSDGTTWTALKTFTGINTTPHWILEEIDLSAYGEMPSVYLRFNAQRANAAGYVYWYVDDVYINAWPAVKTVSITPPASVEEGVPAAFTAGYTSINTSLPITYKWSIAGQEFVTTSPTYNLVFPDAGDIPVTLTVSNPFDSTSVTQTVKVGGNSNNVVLTTLVMPVSGGTVVRSPDQQSFVPGAQVTLAASPAAGYTFTDWTGACAGQGNPCTMTMNADSTITATFTTVEYTLTIVSDGPGTVTRVPDKATYHSGDVVQLTAVPAATYGFGQWKGDLTGSANPASITIDGNKSITATFIQGYTFAVDTIGSGTVTRYPNLSTYLPGQQVTLTAFPGTNWDFSTWSGACTGSGSCVVTMDRSKFITASFTQKQFTLDVIVMPEGGTTSLVSKNPDQATYAYGQRVILTPNPQPGWYFTSWGRDLTGSVNPSVITIDGNKTVYANFSTSYSFPAPTISPTGSGTVTKSPNATSYNYGAAVTVTAAPATGWVFDHWGDSCTGTVNPCVVTVDGAESITAYFINSAYTNVLTVEKTIGGTVAPNPTGGSYADGTPVTLTATPATGYTFGQWNGNCAGQANPCTLTMDGSKSVSATFNPTTFTLTITYNPAEGGGTTTPGAEVITYPYGTVVNVFPSPAAGYKFNNWTGACTGTANCSLTMTANRAVTANFIPVNHNLTIAVDPSVGGTTEPAVGVHPYLEGSVVDVTATPADGYEFAEWSGACSGIGTCTVTMDMPKTATAIFAKDLEYLTVNVTGSGTVIQNPPPPYHHGDEVTLTSDPDHNWEFSSWGGACAGQGNACTLVMDANKTVSAPFIQNLCSLPQNLIGNTGTVREDFESLSGWTISGSQTGYSATIDTTNYKVGNSSVMLTPPSTYGYVRMIKTVNWNMSAPDERGNFRFWVYVHGTGEPVDFSITMSNNQQYSNTFVTYYNSSYKFRYRPGWNLVNLQASDWKVGSGSPSWNNPIVSIRIMVYGTSATKYSIDGLASGANGVPAVILTFDDGHNTLWNQAYAYMEPRNVRGTGYIITNQVDTIDRVTWPQLQEIYATGWTIGNHTQAHTTLTNLSLSGQEAALLAARNDLNAHGMMNVDYVAYPYGNYNADTLTAMANLDMRSSRSLLNFNNVSPLTNPFELAQKSIGRATTWATTKGYVDTAISRGEILALTLHDVSSNPTSSGMYSDLFQDLVDYLVSQGVPILTMDDLYKVQSSAIAVPQPINGSCWGGSAQSEFTLRYTAGTGGTLTGNTTQTVDYGANSTPVTALANTGYHFVNWSDGSTANPRTDTNVMANVTVTANFAINTYTLTVTQPTTGGSITPTTAVYNYNTIVTLTAAPATGYSFTAWTGDCSSETTATCTLTMGEAKAVSAAFTLNTFTLNYTAGTGGTLTGNTTQTVDYGANSTPVTALANTGYHFVNWSDGSTANPRTDTNVMANVTVTANFELITPTCYILTLSHTNEGSDPVASATNSIGCPTGQYIAGESVQLIEAVPTPGWQISSWTGTADDTSTASTNSLIMPANDHSIAVNYAQIDYTLTVISTHGPVNASQAVPYHLGDTVTLTMGAVDAGWTFTGWSVPECVGTSPCTVTINENIEITANFTQNEYALTITQAADGSITATPLPPYHLNTGVTLTATPDPGWSFSAWTGDCSTETTATCTLTMDGPKIVSALFIEDQYTLTVISEYGTVSMYPYQETYTYETEVLLTMETVDPGWTFSGWSGGGCGGIEPCTVTITGDTEITATFTQDEYSLTVGIDPADSGNGVTLSDSGPYNYGDPVKLTPVLAAGWQFDHWMVGGTNVTDNPLNITITGNMVVTAYFIKIPYALTLIASPTEGGTVTANEPNPVYYHDAVVVTATPAAGYSFSHWEGACTNNGECTVMINGDTSVTAVFTEKVYTLTVTVQGSGTVSADKQPPYYYNDLVNLTTSAEVGWTFTGWEGACSGNGDCQVTMDDNKSVSAIFDEDAYALDITIVGNGTVTPNNPGPYNYGEEVVLTAVPDTGWVVSEWSAEGCTGETCTVTMYGDQGIIVTFTPYIEYSLTTSVEGNGSILKNPDSMTYPRDTMVQLTAVANPGWQFDRWTDDCAGQGNPCVLTMGGDKTATAVFMEMPGLPLNQNLIKQPGTVLEGFESRSDWTVSGSGSGYSAALDTVNIKEGDASIKLTTPASGNVTITKTVAWDLSANQGNFRLWVYVSGVSEPTGGSIILSTDTAVKNYFITSYGGAFKLRYKPGWNLINLRTLDWKVIGTPNWANIVRLRIRLDSRQVNTYSFDGLASGVSAQPAVIFTFDKGLSSLYSQAFSYMESRNVRGTGYIPTNLVGNSGQASWAQLQTMYNAGWTIGNNTMAGTSLAGLSQADQITNLSGAQAALNAHGILNADYVSYPGGTYDASTMAAMNTLGMRTGRTLLTFNNISPLSSPFEIAQRSVVKNTSLSTAESWVDAAIARQEILVITIQGLSSSPATSDWYVARFQSLVHYCIQQGIPIITMDDLYQLQSGDITIPVAQ